MFAVTGITGQVGGSVASKLLAEGLPVRAVVRNAKKGAVWEARGCELALAEIWGELLGRPQVGVDDDFFELGGHSLLATQVVSRVRERLSRELPLRSIFESSSIAALAQALDVDTPAYDEGLAPLLPIARDAYRIAATELDSPLESHQSGGTPHVE